MQNPDGNVEVMMISLLPSLTDAILTTVVIDIHNDYKIDVR